MNKLGQSGCPFLFIIKYDMCENIVLPLNQINPKEIKYDFSQQKTGETKTFNLEAEKIDFNIFNHAFQYAQNGLLKNKASLLNLTLSTSINNYLNLEEIYSYAGAKYKLWINDLLVCFSPETFIKVNPSDIISTFPMKGTIDASIENAERILIDDIKERTEHDTVIRLVKSDLKKIAKDIKLARCRFIESIQKENGTRILQTSSEITGKLPEDWKENIGNWLFKILPAGSIFGMPRTRIKSIIENAEKTLHPDGNRGFYTGVFGIFDGKTLDSAVMIRIIEKYKDQLYFKTGAGVNQMSKAEKEYEEIYQKLYIPK